MRILWLTNVPANYRKGIWYNLASRSAFTLVFAEGLAHFKSEEIDWVNWKVMFSPLRYFHDAGKSWSGFRKELALQDLVIICGWNKWYYFLTLVFCKRHGIPTVVFYESISSTHRFKNSLAYKVRSLILGMGEQIIAPSPDVLDTLKRHDLDESKFIACNNPVDVDRISDFMLKNRVQSPKSQHNFLYVGQLIKRKNVSNLVEAFNDSRFENDFLTIVGSGELENEIRALRKKLNLEHRVELIPHSSEGVILQLLSRHQTLVLPSTEDVWGMVAAEALSAKIGVIVTKNCGIAESIKDFDGVQICMSDIESIQSSMLQARSEWNGPFKRLNLDKFRPEHFCDILIDSSLENQRFRFTPVAKRVEESSKPNGLALNGKWTWITNIPSNYRIAIWKSLIQNIDLTVYCIKQKRGLKNNSSENLPFYIRTPGERIFSKILFTRNFVKDGLSAEILVVGGWHNPSYIFLVLVRKFLKRKTLIHYGSTIRTHSDFNYLFRLVRIVIMKQATAVLAYSESCARTLVFEGVPESKIRIFLNPVDAKLINKSVKRLRGNKFQNEGHNFLFVGQLISRKGIVELLYAFQVIRNPNDLLRIVGKGKMDQHILKLILELDLVGSVELIKHTEFNSLLDIYADSQTLVLPSLSEVWGLVVNEALAAQLNVVVSRKCGVSESLQGLKNAFVYGDDIQGLMSAMRIARDSWTDWSDEEFFLTNDTEKFASDLIVLCDELI